MLRLRSSDGGGGLRFDLRVSFGITSDPNVDASKAIVRSGWQGKSCSGCGIWTFSPLSRLAFVIAITRLHCDHTSQISRLVQTPLHHDSTAIKKIKFQKVQFQIPLPTKTIHKIYTCCFFVFNSVLRAFTLFRNRFTFSISWFNFEKILESMWIQYETSFDKRKYF